VRGISMRKYISLILCSVMLASSVNVAYAENDTAAEHEAAEMLVEIIEGNMTDTDGTEKNTEKLDSDNDKLDSNFDEADTDFIDSEQNDISDESITDSSDMNPDGNEQDELSHENNLNAEENKINETQDNDTDSEVNNKIPEISETEQNDNEIMPLIIESESDSWTNVSGMTEQRADSRMLSVGGDLYAIGGMGNSGYLSTMEKYNSADNAWQIVTDIPNLPKGFGAVTDGTKIYIVGGYSGGEYSDAVQVYDVSKGTWGSLSSMNEKRDQPAVLYMDNKIYVFGGRNENEFVNNYEYYDFSDNKWHMVTTNFSDSMIRIGAKAEYIGGYVCIYGGIDKNYEYGGADMYLAEDLKNSQNIVSGGYESISIAWGADKALIFAQNSENNYNIHEMTVEDGIIRIADVVFENTNSAGKYTQYVIYDGYLYAAGGYNTAAKKYLNSFSKYSVYYGDYSIGDGTINNVSTAAGNSVTMNVEAGREYMIFVNVKNMSSFDGYTFAVEYPEDSFSVEDSCALTAEKDTGIGAVDGTDIYITKSGSNGLSFICTENLSGNTGVTKSINAVILRANSSGRRTITYSMIH